MNAYELADRLENELNLSENLFVFDAANMLRHQADYIAQLEKGLESSIAMNKAQAERQVKELTDEEIIAVGNAVVNLIDSNEGWLEFARAILRKAQENG